MGNVNIEMEILRMHQTEVLEIKNPEREMKNVFDGLIRTLDMAEERISELKPGSIESSNIAERKKTDKIGVDYLRTTGNDKSCNIRTMGMPEGEK